MATREVRTHWLGPFDHDWPLHVPALRRSLRAQFGFDEDVRISAESEFRYFDGQAEWIWRPEPGSSQVAARTLALLGSTITGFESNENGTLAVNFSNGRRLAVLDSSSEYESYVITRPGQTIIV